MGEEFDFLFGIVTSGTEWHFLLFTTRGVFCTSQEPLCVRITKFALDESSDAGKLLNMNVKEIIEVIVGMLQERIGEAGSEPAAKRQRVESIVKEKQ